MVNCLLINCFWLQSNIYHFSVCFYGIYWETLCMWKGFWNQRDCYSVEMKERFFNVTFLQCANTNSRILTQVCSCLFITSYTYMISYLLTFYTLKLPEKNKNTEKCNFYGLIFVYFKLIFCFSVIIFCYIFCYQEL